MGSRDPGGAVPGCDPTDPATWIRPVACDGNDRHDLTAPLRRTAWSAVAGAVLIAVAAHWHVHGRSVGVGIGLLLVPVFTVLFARWVDGHVLCYRTWGRLRRLDLDSVTAVGLGKQTGHSSSVTLSAPRLRKPLRVALRGPRYVVSPAAREHLRRRLSSPSVYWDPDAAALFDGGVRRETPRRSRLVAALLVIGAVCVAASGLWLGLQRGSHPAIAGAPGYFTYGDQNGKVLAVGRPWGLACQPVRFTVGTHVPDWIYGQAAAVVAEARQAGIDVTIETRDFMWTPASLYYAPGQFPGGTVRIPIFVKDGTPPRRHDGKPEHIDLGFDTRTIDEGRHEALTDVQGIVYTQSIGTDARSSLRQLIAMTQGVLDADRSDSAIALDPSVDRFSTADIAAMKLMSGCGDAVGPVATP